MLLTQSSRQKALQAFRRAFQEPQLMGGMPSIGPVSDLQRPDKALEALSAFMVSHGLPLRSRLNASAWRASRSPRLCQDLCGKVNVTITTW